MMRGELGGMRGPGATQQKSASWKSAPWKSAPAVTMRIRTLSFLCLLAACQSPCPPATRSLPPAEGAIRLWADAFLRRDLASIVNCYESSPDTVLFHSTGVVLRGIDAIARDYAAAFEATEFVAADYEPTVVRQVDSSAWMTGRLWMHTRQAGRDYVLQIGTSFTMQWIDEAWRIVMEQSTPLQGVPRVREVRPGEIPAPPKKAPR